MPLDAPNNSGDNLTTTFRHIEAYLYQIAQNSGGGSSLPDQTGNAGEFLTTNGSAASWAAISTAPALPVWTYTAGAIGAGQFTANTTLPESTTSMIFSNLTKNGPSDFSNLFDTHVFMGTVIYMTDPNGISIMFQLSSNGSGVNMPVEVLGFPPLGYEWSGDYQVFFIPPTTVQEAANASSVAPLFTGNLGTPGSLNITSGIITDAT